jgi:drug/metabolite transporter (DMT)-like permease
MDRPATPTPASAGHHPQDEGRVPARRRGPRLASRKIAATAALLAATAIWGSTFLVTRRSLPGISAASFLTWRFGIAAAVLILARPGRLRALTRAERRHGLILGLFLGTGFLLQTIGLRHTTAGISGFLTGTMVILTPLFAAWCFHERVGRAGWIAVGISATGIALLLVRGAALTTGALLTLAGAGCFAGHITALSRWATAHNAYGLTACSVSVAALMSAAFAGVTHSLARPPTGAVWLAVLYLALAATCIGFVIQAWAQAALSAATAAVIMTMEPVFAAVIATIAGGESIGAAGWAGGALVVSAMFLSELGPRDCCDALAPRIECC